MGRHGPGTHMAGNAIASHLKFMRNGRRCPGQVGAAQSGVATLIQLVSTNTSTSVIGDMTLSAGDLLRMGCNGRIAFQFIGPAAFGMTGQAVHRGKIGLLDLVRDDTAAIRDIVCASIFLEGALGGGSCPDSLWNQLISYRKWPARSDQKSVLTCTNRGLPIRSGSKEKAENTMNGKAIRQRPAKTRNIFPTFCCF